MLDNRVKKVTDTDTIKMLYDGYNCVADYNDADNLLRHYITPGLDENVLVYDVDNTEEYFYLHDGLGTVRQIINDTQTIENNYDYEGFGTSISHSENIYNRYRYTGREYDKETESDPTYNSNEGTKDGLYYYRARTYDSTIGSFTSRDPIPSGNLYPYCSANPINFTDPKGKQWAGSGGSKEDWEKRAEELRKMYEKEKKDKQEQKEKEEARRNLTGGKTQIKTSDLIKKVGKSWNSSLCGKILTNLDSNLEDRINSEIGTDDIWVEWGDEYEYTDHNNSVAKGTKKGEQHVYGHVNRLAGDATSIHFEGQNNKADSLDDAKDTTIVHEVLHVLIDNINLDKNLEEDWVTFLSCAITSFASSVRTTESLYQSFMKECLSNCNIDSKKCCMLAKSLQSQLDRLTTQLNYLNRSIEAQGLTTWGKIDVTSGMHFNRHTAAGAIKCVQASLNDFKKCNKCPAVQNK